MLPDKKYEISEAKLEYIPKTTVEINSIDEARKILRFIDVLEEHDDVQNVYANFNIDDQVIEELTTGQE